MPNDNENWTGLQTWFFEGEAPLGAVESADGTTDLAEEVDKIAEDFHDWATHDYQPGCPIILEAEFIMDVLTLESCLRRLADETAYAHLLLDVWKAAADCSVNATGESLLWRRGALVLALAEMDNAHAAFEEARLYTGVLDGELEFFNWQDLEAMPAILRDPLVIARIERSKAREAEEKARKRQMPLFGLDELWDARG